jgi:hypothetical protein
VFEDPSTQKITLNIAKGSATSTAVQILNYPLHITRTRNEVFRQTDWAGGGGQEHFATTTDGAIVNGKFSSTTGGAILSSTSSVATFPASAAPSTWHWAFL